MTAHHKRRIATTNHIRHARDPGPAARRVLILANETIAAGALYDLIATQRDIAVHVVAPALNSRIRHWTSDEDRARREAGERLGTWVRTLDHAGVQVDGQVGDADPLLAIADALVGFEADEVLVAAQPEHRSNWLARDLVRRAGNRFELPVSDIVDARVAAPVALAAAA